MELQAKRNKASESPEGSIRPDAGNISPNQGPYLEVIRLRAYEIHLERGGLAGYELDDWLQAERELQRAERQKAPAYLIAGENA
jgi:Protein of unknown function (DUF2934)